ncbi:MAG: hypothetical protein ACD_8C00086G0006 [uncultured bacterium]|nr:MAG: hypothetical protein ACD_8C00086G0006 [uncultured bacterium]
MDIRSKMENKNLNQNQNQTPSDRVVLSWKDLKKEEPSKLKTTLKKFSLWCHSRAGGNPGYLSQLVLNSGFRIKSGMTMRKIPTFLKDHWHLLIKSAAQNHLRIQECKKPQAGQVCNLEFGSFSELKRYQKKVRLFTYSFSSTMVSVAIAIVAMQMFFGTGSSQGASYVWQQDNWLVTNTGATANHTNINDRTEFEDYVSRDDGIAPAGTASESGADTNKPVIELVAQDGNVTQANDGTTNSGFNLAGNVKANTMINGTADNAKIEIQEKYAQVVAGYYHNLALKSDGTVWAWGYNYYGRLGDGSTINRIVPVQVSGLTEVSAISAAFGHSMALKSDGTLWTWGYNNRGQLGNNSITQSLVPVQVLTGVASISAGYDYSLAVKSDGTVWAWGRNYYGQFGNNSTIDSLVPIQVSGLTGVTSISATSSNNYSHSLALKSDGTVWGWGYNSTGQLGNNSATQSLVPVQALGLTGVVSISAGSNHSMALKSDGTAWIWGGNSDGQLGNNSTAQSLVPVQVPGLSGVSAISAGNYHSMALKSDGTVWAWGRNSSGQLGNNSTTVSLVPIQVLTGTTSVSAGTYHSMALKSDGAVWGWGNNEYKKIISNTNLDQLVPVKTAMNAYISDFNDGFVPSSQEIKSIATSSGGSYGYSLALKSDKTVWAWGYGGSGVLGNGTGEQMLVGYPVRDLTGVEQISAGEGHSLALRSDGTAWAWGDNAYGMLGNNSTVTSSIPVQVSGLTGVSSVKAGRLHSMALKSDGTVWAWGYNTEGQLGDGSTTQRLVPVQVSGLEDVIAISAGDYHSMVIKSDGTVWAWGRNSNGQLGNNSTTGSLVPVQVPGLTGVALISAGTNTSAAVKSDGTALAWGSNTYGQLCDGSNIQRLIPVQVSEPVGVGALSMVVANSHSLILKLDGTVWGCGRNDYGPIGNNSITDSKVPVQTLGLAGVVSISAGLYHSMALKSDGTIWGWGYNGYGQLGDNSTTSRLAPVASKRWFFPDDYLNLGGGYEAPGTFESGTIDLGKKTINDTINLSWDQTLPTGVGADSLGFQVASDVASGGVSNFYGPDGNSHSDCNGENFCYTTNGGQALHSQHYGARKLRYKAFLQTADTMVTPSVSSVTFDYQNYPTSNQRAFYRLDGTVGVDNVANGAIIVDDSVYNNSATASNAINGTGMAYQAGKSSQALNFDGVDDYVSIPASPSLNLTSNPVTMEAWVKTNAIGTTQKIFSKGQTGLNGYGISISSTGYINIGGNGGGNFNGTSILITPNVWHHVVGVIDDVNTKIYVDGVADLATGTVNVKSGEFSAQIGASQNSSSVAGSFFNGLIDEVAIYDRVLSLEEITANFNAGSPARIEPGKFLTSSWYNTGSDSNVFSAVRWDESNVPAGTKVKMQVQTAPTVNSGTPTDPTGFLAVASGGSLSESAFFDSTSSGCSKEGTIVTCNVPQETAISNGSGDQWLQYKLTMDSDGQSTPQVDQIKMEYVVNSPPLISIETQASQKTVEDANTGTVELAYSIQNGGAGINTEGTDTFQSALFYTSENGEGLKLTSYIDNDALTVGVTGSDGQYLPDVTAENPIRYIQIDNEVIEYVSKDDLNDDDDTTWSLTVPSGGRGSWPTDEPVWSSGAAFHNATTPIYVHISNNVSTVQSASEVGLGNLLGNDGLALPGDTNPAKTYALRWEPQTDPTFGDRYEDQLILKVTSNDKNSANQIGSASTSPFVVDTKNPEISAIPFTIDHRENKLTIEEAVQENSDYKIYISKPSDGINKEANVAASETPTSSFDYTYATMDSDPATVYIRYKDDYGNYTDGAMQTPSKPDHVRFYDVSNMDVEPKEYQELVSWDGETATDFLNYKVERKPCAKDDTCTWSTIKTLDDADINYYTDKTVALDSTYTYRVYTTDEEGNISRYSETVTDTPDGSGSTDRTPPIISNPTITEIGPTSARVSWITNKESNSTVYYKEYAQAGDYETGPSKATMTFNHSVIITGLKSSTESDLKKYAIKIVSSDAKGNTGSMDKETNPELDNDGVLNFTTKNGPEIRNFSFTRTSNTEVSIAWNTSTNANAEIHYSSLTSGTTEKTLILITDDLNTEIDESLNSGSAANLSDFTQNHELTITKLTPATRYYFYIRSTDQNGSVATDNNGGNLYEFTTDNDQTKPVITIDEFQPSIISNNQVAISWSTDEQATTILKYKKKTEDEWTTLEPNPGIYDESHFVVISDLFSETKYDYKVISADISGNGSEDEVTKDRLDNELEFETLPDPDKNHPPLEVITFSDDNPSPLTDTDAVINFATDQIANCILNSWEYDVPEIINVPIQEEEGSYNLNHSMHLSKLKFQTKYGYEVHCHDNLKDDNDEYLTVSSEKKDFVTTEKLYTEAGAGALGDKLSPVINNVKVASTTGESAVITWDTNEIGSSSVRYGIAGVEENSASDSAVNYDKTKFVTSHTVTINGLIPAAKYIFVASSTDPSGNIGTSAESSFTTASPSSLSSIKAESLNLGEAQITWNTSSETSSIVEYGLTTSYGEKKESSTLTKEHSISLSNLNQGVTYHFRVKGQDQDKKLYSSSDQTFEPKSPAQVSNININDITEHEATISFNTNIPTTATVIYTNIQDPSDNGSQADNEMATKHSIQIKNLTQGATFKIQIKARDEQGTESQTDGKDLTTGKDENPPKIDMVKTDLALAQNDKVQAIISWNTDEQSTTSVLYKEGRNAEAKEIDISEALSTNHVAVITSFKPGTVYYFNTKSVDASGNEAKSTDYALLTPRRKENIIQIIIGNFTDIFGWAKF